MKCKVNDIIEQISYTVLDVLTVDFEQTNEQTNDIWKPQESRN